MKIKLLITVVSAVLLVVFLIIDLKSVNDSATDKWTSFGLGAMAPILVSGVISIVRAWRQKAV